MADLTHEQLTAVVTESDSCGCPADPCPTVCVRALARRTLALLDENAQRRRSEELLTQQVEEAKKQMQLANRHSARMLRAIQDSRAAEREIFAVCTEVNQLPDRQKNADAFKTWILSAQRDES